MVLRTALAKRKCSFCDRSDDEVGYMIAGPGQISICDDCVDLFAESVKRHRNAVAHSEQAIPNPDD